MPFFLQQRGKFPVVVDPIVGDKLRPHQRDGVRFLYNCITGQGGFQGNGAILADEMYVLFLSLSLSLSLSNE